MIDSDFFRHAVFISWANSLQGEFRIKKAVNPTAFFICDETLNFGLFDFRLGAEVTDKSRKLPL